MRARKAEARATLGDASGAGDEVEGGSVKSSHGHRQSATPRRVSSLLRRLTTRLPLAIGSIAVLSLVPLLAWDAAPARLPSRSHDVFGAGPLLAIAVSYFAQQLAQRPPLLGWTRAVIVVAAFVAWAASQCLLDRGLATRWNDIAIALFVIDIFLSIAKAPGPVVAWPVERLE